MNDMNLRKCPFCGGNAKFWIGFDFEIGVICENCSTKTAAQCWSKEEAAEEWNNGKYVK